jgi:hypothetical protein
LAHGRRAKTSDYGNRKARLEAKRRERGRQTTARWDVPKTKKIAAKVTVDRRDSGERRKIQNERRGPAAAAVASERRVVGERREKVNRRRQIDPTTCERDYTDAEVEFMHALDQYKRSSGRMFPTCSEVLEVLRGLGYEKLSRPAPIQTAPEATAV